MLTVNFSPHPVIDTPRLILRQPAQGDVPNFFLMRSDPEVMKYIPRPLAQSHADVDTLLELIETNRLKNERINWAIEWKETGDAVGMIGFVNTQPEHHRGEVGYSLMRNWHRKGIMREALLAVLQYGFKDLNFHTIEAIIDADNTPSGKLLESVGFRQEAYFKEDFLHNGEYRNSIHYGMLHSEFKNEGA